MKYPDGDNIATPRIRTEYDSLSYIGKVFGGIRERIKNYGKNEGKVVFTKKLSESSNLCNSVDDYDKVFQKKSYPSSNDLDVTSSKDDTPVKRLPKKLRFSSTDNIVFEVDPWKHSTNYTSSTPTKCIARMYETPKPKMVEIRTITQKQTEKTESITKEILQEVNLIRNLEEFKPLDELFDGNIQDKTFMRSPSCKSTDEKFVVNLFESRSSKRWQRKNICVSNLNQIHVVNEPSSVESGRENHNTNFSSQNAEQEELVENGMFQKLKRERDVECVKMNQASNILKAIKINPRRDWSEELLAEKILLEADQKYKLIVNKIRELKFSDVKSKEKHQGVLTLSNFEYALKSQEEKKNKYSEFFVLTLSYDRELIMSQVATPTDNKLVFNEKFTFKNVDSNFNIKAQVFSLRLKTKGRTYNLLKKETTDLCPTWRIFYENVTTRELKESKVLRTSFMPCGEINITKNDIGTSGTFEIKNEEPSPFKSIAKCSLSLENLEINTHLAGFLTLGLPNSQKDVLHWERKWCVLNSSQLIVFNYPSQEYLGQPTLRIELKDCLLPFQTNLTDCLKRRNFSLLTNRFSYANDTQNDLYQKPNIVVEKFCFFADTNEDFEKWTGEIKSILDCLEDFHVLGNGDV